jgi:Ca2+-binding RTX toxin-like protein
VLENAIFTALTATGMLGTGNLVIGTSAVDADEYIIYDAATGSLSYDGDGSGLGAATKFAAVSASLALTNADFLVI